MRYPEQPYCEYHPEITTPGGLFVRRPFLLLSPALCFVSCSHGSALSGSRRSGPVETGKSAVEPEALTPASEQQLRDIWLAGGCLNCSGPTSLSKVRQ